MRGLHRLCTGRLFAFTARWVSASPATLEHAFEQRLGGHNVTSASATHSKDAAPLGWEAATMVDLWRLSDATGIPAGAILRALDKLEGADPESVSERVKH